MRSGTFLAAVAAAAALVPAATAALPVIPQAFVWRLETPRANGVRNVVVTVRCGNGFAMQPFWIKRGATGAVLPLLRAERTRIAAGTYGFSEITSPCTAHQRNAPVAHLLRVLGLRHLLGRAT